MPRPKRKTREKPRPPAPPAPTGLDATPERLAREPQAELVAAAIDKAGERRGLARRFRAAHLDRLHKSGSLSYAQWYAGDVYRQTHARCQLGQPVVAAYGERTRAGEHPGSFGYGLAHQESQLRARRMLEKMRATLPRPMLGFMDRLLIHDEMPRYGGRAAMRNLAEIRKGLDALAGFLRVG